MSEEIETQSGGLDDITCKCGCVNGFKGDTLKRIHQVDHHIRTCEHPDSIEHGYAQEFECARCHAFLCRMILLKEEFVK